MLTFLIPQLESFVQALLLATGMDAIVVHKQTASL